MIAGAGTADVGVFATLTVGSMTTVGTGRAAGASSTTDRGGCAGSEGFGGSGSGGRVASEDLGSSGGSWGVDALAASRLPRDVGKADTAKGGCGAEKPGLVLDSGGLNTPLPELTDTGPLVASTGPGTPKPNCAAPSPKANLRLGAEASVSPWPTRSPEKLPRVSPPGAVGAWGSTTLRVGVAVEGLAGSPDMLGGGVEEVLTPSAGELDLEAKEKGSSPAALNTLLPLPKANLLMSFTVPPAPWETDAKLKLEDPGVKENALLVPCSVALVGVSVLGPNMEPEAVVKTPCVGFRLA